MTKQIAVVLLLALMAPLQAQVETPVSDLATALRDSLIAIKDASGTGASSGSSVEAQLENMSGKEVNIDVYMSLPVFLVNRGAGQNMVLSQVYGDDGAYTSDGERSFITLQPRQSLKVVFVAYCADFEKENPLPSEGFAVGSVPPILESVVRNITAFARRNPNADLTVPAQVAVWLAQGVEPAEIAKKFPFTASDERLARTFLRQGQSQPRG